jgi:hypothetical protein
MNDFLQALGPFAYGFAVGYFWYPLWQLGKRIVSEARKATQEWNRPGQNR